MATGELRRNAGGLLDKLREMASIGPSITLMAQLVIVFRKFFAVEAPWTTAIGVRDHFAIVIEGGELVAAQTETTIDDELVAQAKALIPNDSLMESVAWVIRRFLAETPDGTAAQFQAFLQRDDVQESLADHATAQGISLGEIMQVIKLITELVTLLKGMFGGTATAPAGGTTTGGGLFDF